jgi:hypothetical protein
MTGGFRYVLVQADGQRRPPMFVTAISTSSEGDEFFAAPTSSASESSPSSRDRGRR